MRPIIVNGCSLYCPVVLSWMKLQSGGMGEACGLKPPTPFSYTISPQFLQMSITDSLKTDVFNVLHDGQLCIVLFATLTIDYLFKQNTCVEILFYTDIQTACKLPVVLKIVRKENIEGDVGIFRPGMDWQVRFGKADNRGKATIFEIMEYAAHVLQVVLPDLLLNKIPEQLRSKEFGCIVDGEVCHYMQTWNRTWWVRVLALRKRGTRSERVFHFISSGYRVLITFFRKR